MINEQPATLAVSKASQIFWRAADVSPSARSKLSGNYRQAHAGRSPSTNENNPGDTP